MDLCNNNEKQRIDKLLNYKILDTDDDFHLNSITKLVSIVCNVPICLISLVDINRQWFKSKVGLNVRETDRNVAFCDYTIKNYDILEVNDALLDLRFVNNPLVTGDPKIRFYAGMPLTSPEGFNIGTLCIIDTKPRKLNETEKLLLKTLSVDIINHIELLTVNRLNSRQISINDKIEKENFLSNISHELRTPLNAIYGFTQLMLETKLDHKQEEYISIIKMSIENMIRLINQILDSIKINNGKMKIENYLFDIHHNMKYIYDLFKKDADVKGLSFHINIDKKIPKQLNGDGIRLNQILINFISNAIKFTDNGSVICNLTVSEDNEKESIIQFSVKDTGIGIPIDKINKLFLSFEQLHHNNFKNFGGSGLGLSISNNLVKILGGNIHVRSKEGRGSEFYFKLKFIKNNNEVTKSQNRNNNIFKNKKVLLCEDTDLNVKLIKNIIEKFEMDIDCAENGKIAIEKLKVGHFDFILMDLNMPQLDGYETTEYIRKRMKSSIPIIAITANNSDIEKEKCFKYGMNDFISKPFNYNVLHDIFHKIIVDINFNNKRVNIKKDYNDKCLTQRYRKYKIINDKMNEDIEEINIKSLKDFTGDDIELEKELINKFIDDFPKNLKTLENEIKKNNYIEIKSIAHRMKSCVKIFSLNKLYEKVIEIEKLCILKNVKLISKEYLDVKKFSVLYINQFKDVLRNVYENNLITC